MASDKSKRFILWFNEIGIEDIPMVGGKNASLGRCIRNSTNKASIFPTGLPSPPMPTATFSSTRALKMKSRNPQRSGYPRPQQPDEKRQRGQGHHPALRVPADLTQAILPGI